MSARVLALSLALVVLGCGGSSSETPPPLEPNPMSARYTGPRMGPRDEGPAPTQGAPEPREELGEPAPSLPARATWGSGKPPSTPPRPVPTMTSPNALPTSSAPSPSASSPSAPPPSATGAPASAF